MLMASGMLRRTLVSQAATMSSDSSTISRCRSAVCLTAERTLREPTLTEVAGGPGLGSTPPTSKSATTMNDDRRRGGLGRNSTVPVVNSRRSSRQVCIGAAGATPPVRRVVPALSSVEKFPQTVVKYDEKLQFTSFAVTTELLPKLV